MPGRPDSKLVKLLVRAHHLKEKLRASPGTRIADVAMQQKLSPSYVALLLRLTFLAPDITRAILEGRQPGGFTAHLLALLRGTRTEWRERGSRDAEGEAADPVADVEEDTALPCGERVRENVACVVEQ